VDIERIDRQQRLPPGEAIEVDISNDEAGGAAIGVPEDPLEVAPDRYRRPSKAVERRARHLPGVKSEVEIVRLGYSLKQRRHHVYDSRRRLNALQLGHCCRRSVIALLARSLALWASFLAPLKYRARIYIVTRNGARGKASAEKKQFLMELYVYILQIV